MAQRYKFSIESKNFPLDISGEPIIIRYRRKTDGYKKKMSKGKILNSPANCVDTWIRTKDPHHVKVIL